MKKQRKIPKISCQKSPATIYTHHAIYFSNNYEFTKKGGMHVCFILKYEIIYHLQLPRKYELKYLAV